MDQRMLQKLLADAQKGKKLLDKRMAEIENTTFSVSVGGNLINLSANGKYEILSCTISPDALSDVETLQDLVVSAFNDLVKKVQEEVKKVEASFVPKMPF
ncbi:conserved hypothetical protein [Mycoplasma haemofelis str. Langford 1]|uniref:Nucleoid-associated protein MHF_0079 n=2 Tax=Mycoplasma haemofelis TaxID=29501 RepID=F6FFJ5_MYCHI|nr:YbaB/EbfC family nucleoid-associated protein [Mycoplasma haemofelis]AEG72390.1 hypothetical protein MHF_0079 [Mycoplasma haemofelis Ohio2]CBY92077.1 conserved hypothetical protein [Mycoplasma haemofelis str. Langford 1]